LIAVEAILRNSSYEPSDVHITAIDTGLLWTSDAIVPIMDAFRLALLNRRFNEIYCGVKTERETGSRGMNTLQKLIAVLTNAVSDPVRILACRAIANAAVHRWGREMLMNGLNDSLAVVISQLSSRKEALQLAAASAAANWSLLLLRHSESSTADESSLRRDMTKTLVKYLKMTESFGGYSEATKIRILQALATVMWGDIAVIKVAKEADVVGTVNRVKDALVAECGKAIARDIVGMSALTLTTQAMADLPKPELEAGSNEEVGVRRSDV
uniref:PUL domain-containing protein n=1 Tax=Toxocara canis TaxID=6265 RepID=A0A183VCD0_TOXCA